LISAAPIVAEDVQLNFGVYGSDPALLAAVTSGLASVTPCDVPVEYIESRADKTVTLNIRCDGSHESNAIITFTDYGDFLLVESFQFAG